MSDASRTADAPAYRALATDLLRHVARIAGPRSGSTDRRLVIGVAGESGSGKSVTAVSLARALREHGTPAGVLHQDDYFRRPPRVNHAHRERDLAHVGPHEVDLARLAEHVASFRAGLDGIEAPLVDYPTDAFVTRRLDFGPLAALVVEGTYVLQLPDLDVRVFLEATHEDTAERRRQRNRDIDAPFVQQVLRIEHEIIVAQAAHAHVLVDKDFRIRRNAQHG